MTFRVGVAIQTPNGIGNVPCPYLELLLFLAPSSVLISLHSDLIKCAAHTLKVYRKERSSRFRQNSNWIKSGRESFIQFISHVGRCSHLRFRKGIRIAIIYHTENQTEGMYVIICMYIYILGERTLKPNLYTLSEWWCTHKLLSKAILSLLITPART